MTVSTEVDHNDYIGNGVTTSFPYTFRIFKKSDLVVQVVDLNENITELILDTDYTVTGAGGYSGGNVILMSALANGYQISISRELPVTQETDLRNQGKFFAEVHEDVFDYLTMLIQQVTSWLGLALRRPTIKSKFYDAKQFRIANLADPINAQDAVNNQTLLKSLADLSTDGSGQFVLQMLASPAVGLGASLVNTESGINVEQTFKNMFASTSPSVITIGQTLKEHSFGYDGNMALYTKGQYNSPSSFQLDGFSLRSGVFEGIRIITVGDSGDFSSLNDAIAFASLFKPKYVNSPGYIHNRIEIEIQSGFIVTEQVVARQIDLSHITLTSVDPIVKVNVPTNLWWMYGEFAAHLPIIGTIFDLQHIGYDGLSLKMGSQAIVEYGHSRNGKPTTKYAGIINAARHNVFINTGCTFVGRECVFTGALEAGVHFEKHCTGCVRDADISGCTLFGIRLINGSTIDCYGVNVSNTSSGPGIQAEVGSTASGFGVIASNSKQGLRASFGSKIVATGSTFNNMAVSDAWAYASDGSDIVMTTATGTGGACACLAANGSRIDIQGVDASLSGSGSGNMRCLSGSTLAATGTTGTFNKAVNAVDGNGIIYK